MYIGLPVSRLDIVFLFSCVLHTPITSNKCSVGSYNHQHTRGKANKSLTVLGQQLTWYERRCVPHPTFCSSPPLWQHSYPQAQSISTTLQLRPTPRLSPLVTHHLAFTGSVVIFFGNNRLAYTVLSTDGLCYDAAFASGYLSTTFTGEPNCDINVYTTTNCAASSQKIKAPANGVKCHVWSSAYRSMSITCH